MHKRHKICSRSLANHKVRLHPRWGAHKELGLSRPKISLNDHQDLVQFSTIKSTWRRGQYKLSEVHHNLGDSRTTPSPSRGQVLKRNEHTEIIDEVLAWRLSGSLKRMAQISLMELRLEWSLRERGFELKKDWFKMFSSELSGQPIWGGVGTFYSPQKESTHWSVRDPDMSGIRGRTCSTSVSVTRPRHRTCLVSGLNPS
jgi:hypothetical protein